MMLHPTALAPLLRRPITARLALKLLEAHLAARISDGQEVDRGLGGRGQEEFIEGLERL